MHANIYRENVRQSDRCTITTELWMLAFLGIAVLVLFGTWLNTEPGDCDPSNTGTDYWYEACMNEGEIDLGADQIQDEAQTFVSQGRVEL